MDAATLESKLKARLEKLQTTYNNAKFCEASINWLNEICPLIGIPKNLVSLCAQILESKPSSKLVWLHMAECTGCTESLLRLEGLAVDSLLCNYLEFIYHETLMANDGFRAKASLESKDDFLLVVEGGILSGEQENYFTSGADSISGKAECMHLCDKAKVIFSVGTCSSYGGVQAAYPNPTNSIGLNKLITDDIAQKIAFIPGCPPSDVNIVGNILYYILLDELPELDSSFRPIWSYGKNLHDLCERKAKFEAGEFVENFKDENLINSFCLYKVGCKGPYVFNNCPKVKFNSKTSWPIKAGHGCIACSEPDFWDNFGVMEAPLNNENAYNFSKKTFNDFENLDSSLKNTHSQDSKVLNVFLGLNGKTRIFRVIDNKEIDFLNVELESNFASFLNGVESRNKLGKKLVENYNKWLDSSKIDTSFIKNAESKISDNVSDIFLLIFNAFNGESNNEFSDKLSVLNLSDGYLFDKSFNFEFKVNQDSSDSNVYILEVQKGLRLILCYLLGGLEINAIAFSATINLCLNLCEIIKKISENNDIEYVHFYGEMAENKGFKNYLNKFLEQSLIAI